MEDGVRFLELVAPVEQANGKLKCEVMKLGDPDEKGRRSPVPTGEFTEIDCDTVIAAVGERVDSDLFTANGIAVNAKGIPDFRTNLENVFVGGDAMRGPATVVEGIADAQWFANAVIGSVPTAAIPDDARAARSVTAACTAIPSARSAPMSAPTGPTWSSRCRTVGMKFFMWIGCATNAATAPCSAPTTPLPIGTSSPCS